ncbi:DUF4352 domain-containing protein [Pseudogracilibacillus sp. SO30301A]|uniref:DUF4352 domain-containing protein n=1 Tax=Pseudogracilibacillus sp. SO30301A TaxID=3098291 RepID=UPI00300E30A8
MRRIWFVMGFLLVLVLSACGSDDSTSSSSAEKNEEEKSVKGVIEPEQFDTMYSDPKAYKGYEVEFTGQVFTEPERDEDAVYLQVFAKPENSEHNVIVYFDYEDVEVHTDDYVQVKGIVTDEFEGENLMGGTVIAPVVEASSIEVIDYITAVSPTLKEIEVNETIKQHGVEVELQKIDIAENETRVYVKLSNNTADTVFFDAYGAKLVTGNNQFEVVDNYESGLPEIPFDILSGIESEGVLTFPAIDENTDSITFHSEAHSDDYELDFKPFVFEIEVE